MPGAKVYAFALSAGIAALGGILLAFRKDVVLYSSEFTSFTSILVVGYAFVGGIGFLAGPLFGSTLAPGSLGTQLSNVIFSSVTQYMHADRRGDPDPARAAEPGRHRQGVDQPAALRRHQAGRQGARGSRRKPPPAIELPPGVARARVVPADARGRAA